MVSNLGKYLAQALLETDLIPEQPIQESPPINFEDEPSYQDYILQNRRKIEQAAYAFNVPIDDMEYAFNGSTEVVLNDDMWKEMENTKSYNMKTLEDAISHALKIGIDPKPYIDNDKVFKCRSWLGLTRDEIKLIDKYFTFK
jgi:hypothetical protein